MSIKTSMILKLLANPKYEPSEPSLYKVKTGNHPSPRNRIFEGKGKFADMPDYVLEHLMDEIIKDESGKYISLMKDVLLIARISLTDTYIEDRQNRFDSEKREVVQRNDEILRRCHQRIEQIEEAKSEVKKLSKEEIIEKIISEVLIDDHYSAIKIAVLGIFYRERYIKPGEKDRGIGPARISEYTANLDQDLIVKMLRQVPSYSDNDFKNFIVRLDSITTNIGPGTEYSSSGAQIIRMA